MSTADSPSGPTRERLTRAERNEQAGLLKSWHQPGAPLVLANAWDALSALLVVRAGARAVATASAAVSWSFGRPDGHGLSREDAARAVERIASCVNVPVTADVEGGYGPNAHDVAVTVGHVVEAGATGVNIEDAPGVDGPLHTAEHQARRLRAARDTATSSGVGKLVINARTDLYLAEVGDPAERFDAALHRARAYADAGADCFFVPGLLDLETLGSLVEKSPLPVSVLAVPGGPSVAELTRTGVCRISTGPALARAAYTAAETAAAEVLFDGTLNACSDSLTFGEFQDLTSPAP